MRLPPSKFECPRCGFGVRPGEEQCGRCGEDLKPKASQPVQVNLASVKLDRDRDGECSTVRIRSIETIQVGRPDSAMQVRTDELNKRERELQERERRLNVKSNEIEERSKEIKEKKEPQPSVDMDEVRRRLREELTRHFEPELEALQAQLDEKEAELQEARLKLQMLDAGQEMEVVDEAELARITEDIFRELHAQVGASLKVVDTGLLRTHINRLDEVLGGGIPQGHIVLFNGSPGTMKSTLAYTILHRAAVNGTPGLYLSVEQSRRSILRQMERMGMPEADTDGKLRVLDMRELRKEMAAHEGNWRELIMGYVRREQEATGFKVFALDSLESFKALTEHCFSRQDLKDLFDWFKSLNITVLVISENTSDEYDEADQGEAYLSDGIMEMLMREMTDSRVQRWVRCVKMRGANVDNRYYSMFHNGKEFNFALPLANQPF
ncbi:MAG TPA: ATPase domain-containing protein [Methanomassiliicoccales archaeon]|nr:ATPase domain-containing protein [Methanomassiliicoccales archaeon]HPR98175.1 ATPase domain-containing protein [Methanomassiliicoccales archaeon]